MIEHKFECSKKMLREYGLEMEELKRLLTLAISITSGSHLSFRIKISDRDVSTKEAEAIKVKWCGYNVGHFEIIVKIKLVGYMNIWKTSIFLKKEMQANAKAFCDEMKEAFSTVCDEENKKYALLEVEKLSPEPTSDLNDESSGVPKSVEATSKPGKRVYIRTSAVATDEKILEILRKWMTKTGGVQRISQREFGEIIYSALGDAINKQMVISFLKKRDVINVISLGGKKYIIEVGKAGLAMLGESRERQEREMQEQEENKILKSIRESTTQSLPQLRALQNILDLQAKIAEYEKELLRIHEEKNRCLKELEKISSSINPADLSKLIKIAEDSARKN